MVWCLWPRDFCPTDNCGDLQLALHWLVSFWWLLQNLSLPASFFPNFLCPDHWAVKCSRPWGYIGQRLQLADRTHCSQTSPQREACPALTPAHKLHISLFSVFRVGALSLLEEQPYISACHSWAICSNLGGWDRSEALSSSQLAPAVSRVAIVLLGLQESTYVGPLARHWGWVLEPVLCACSCGSSQAGALIGAGEQGSMQYRCALVLQNI